jgi:hypothetical protein
MRLPSLGSSNFQVINATASAVPLIEVEPVAYVELVGDREADIAHGEVIDEPPVRPVEQGHGRDGGRAAQLERADEIVERQACVHHVLDDQHVTPADVQVEVLEHADLLVPAHDRAPVAGELDEVERMEDRHRAGEVGDEDEARLQRRDEHRLAVGVVARDLGPELPNAFGDLGGRELDLSDPVVGRSMTGISWRGRDGNAGRGAPGRAGRRA